MKQASAFLKWFVAQYGPRPKNMTESDEDLEKAIVRGRIAQTELDARSQWDAKHESALYAWQIKDEDKSKDWNVRR